MSLLDLDHYKDVFQEYYDQYSVQLVNQIPEISTSTFVLVVLSICIPPIIALIFFELEAAKSRSEEPKGCRKLGLKIESNLLNEFDKKFSEGRPPSTEETSAEWWRVKSLWIYPVKSCRGIELNRGGVLTTGMEYDRQFTFAQLKSPFPVDASTQDKEKAAHKWEFITQRQYPLLARVKTEMWVPDQSVEGYVPHAEDVESGGVIILSFPYQEAGWRGKLAQWGAAVKGAVPEKHFRIPFDPTPAQVEKAGYKYEKMTIWKDTVSALNMELEIPDELRYYLGISNKLGLFRVDNQAIRDVHRSAPKKEELGHQTMTGFQDAYPLHLVNLASIRDVESLMPKVKGSPRLSASRFRANIIITGPEAYNEETWKRVKIGYYEYVVSCRTAHLKLPNDNQAPGRTHLSALDNTLTSFRTVHDEAEDKIGWLGVQLVSISREGAIRVGDELTVTEHGEHFYVQQ